jgi:hypothetical protein
MPHTAVAQRTQRSFYNYKGKKVKLQGCCVARLSCAIYRSRHADGGREQSHAAGLLPHGLPENRVSISPRATGCPVATCRLRELSILATGHTMLRVVE